MKRVQMLPPRGTDVVIAALQLPRRFTRAELLESYGKLRMQRNGRLPASWGQGLSNELARLSSDYWTYHHEGRTLDLFAWCSRGRYAIRDEVRPALLRAANEQSDLFTASSILMVPRDQEGAIGAINNHIVGKYAQQCVMDLMRHQGCEILRDTSLTNSYDFVFAKRDRTLAPQIMECKGTQRPAGEADVTLTPNELETFFHNPNSYWLGIVCNIKIVNGCASGGEPYITPPPVLDRWHFTQAPRLRWRPQPPINPQYELRLIG